MIWLNLDLKTLLLLLTFLELSVPLFITYRQTGFMILRTRAQKYRLYDILNRLGLKFNNGVYNILFSDNTQQYCTQSWSFSSVSTDGGGRRFLTVVLLCAGWMQGDNITFTQKRFCEVHQFQIANLFTLLPSHKKTAAVAVAYSGYIMA